MKVARLLVALVIVLAVIPMAYAQEEISGISPQVKNLAGMAHGGSKCVYCHAFIIPQEEYENKFLKGCRCHGVFGGYNIPISKVKKTHKSQHCKLCHASTRNITFQVYHEEIHNRLECTKCHNVKDSTDFIITRPGQNAENCKACHSYDIHYIHSDKLGKVCKMCHGSQFASKYTRQDLEQVGLEEEVINKTVEGEKEEGEKEEKFGFPTISEILGIIVDFIL